MPAGVLADIVRNSTRLGTRTKAVYLDAIQRFEAMPRAALTIAAVEEFRDLLLREITRTGKPRQPQSAHKMLAGLRYASRRFAERGLGPDFARGAEMPRRPAWVPATGLDLAEARALRVTCAGDQTLRGLRDTAMVDLAEIAVAGRCSEIAALTVGSYLHRDHVLLVPRKGGWQQRCFLDEGTCRVLDAWLAQRGGRAGDPMFVALHPSTSDRLILGDGLSSAGVRHIVAERATEAGIKRRITPHALRHAFFGLGLRAGLPLERLSEGAGHRQPSDRAPAVAARYRHDLLAREQPVGAAIRKLLEDSP